MAVEINVPKESNPKEEKSILYVASENPKEQIEITKLDPKNPKDS